MSTPESKPHSVSWESLRAKIRLGLPLIDTRSPAEHQKGRIPGSHNIPIFDDDERARVGTLYKQQGSQPAVALGLEIFAEKSSSFAESTEQLLGPAREVLVHCWRGGMRSESISLWLNSMGIRCQILRGGYKAYRKEVLSGIEAFAKHDLLVLDGRTGAGKTDLLRKVGTEFPMIDFEGLARHRGSAFGGFAQPAPSPSQQNFENELAERYWDVEKYPRLLVEIENFIGPITLDLSLRQNIFTSPMVLVSRDFDDRVERLSAEYAIGWNETADKLFAERMLMLRRHLSREQSKKIIDAVVRRDFRDATAMLLEMRYDKVYDKGLKKRERHVVAEFNLTHEEGAALAFIRDYVNS